MYFVSAFKFTKNNHSLKSKEHLMKMLRNLMFIYLLFYSHFVCFHFHGMTLMVMLSLHSMVLLFEVKSRSGFRNTLFRVFRWKWLKKINQKIRHCSWSFIFFYTFNKMLFLAFTFRDEYFGEEHLKDIVL